MADCSSLKGRGSEGKGVKEEKEKEKEKEEMIAKQHVLSD